MYPTQKKHIQIHRYSIILILKTCLCVFRLGDAYLSMITKKTKTL